LPLTDWACGRDDRRAGNDAFPYTVDRVRAFQFGGIFVDVPVMTFMSARKRKTYRNGAFRRGHSQLGQFLDMGGKDSYPTA
jgi:hypothetical protein